MKTIVKIAVLVFFLVSSGMAMAQQEAIPSQKKYPKWISDNGFWVVESNVHTPRQQTVFFYNNDAELVYQEKVPDTKLNIQKKKTRNHKRKVSSSSFG